MHLYQVKILGVVFQKPLSWDAQNDPSVARLSHRVGLVCRNRHILLRNVMIFIYNSLFSSRLHYYNLVLASTTLENIYKIHVPQKRFWRGVENVPSYFHTHELLVKYNVLPIPKMYDYRHCRAIRKQVKRKSPFLKELDWLTIYYYYYCNTTKACVILVNFERCCAYGISYFLF